MRRGRYVPVGHRRRRRLRGRHLRSHLGRGGRRRLQAQRLVQGLVVHAVDALLLHDLPADLADDAVHLVLADAQRPEHGRAEGQRDQHGVLGQHGHHALHAQRGGQPVAVQLVHRAHKDRQVRELRAQVVGDLVGALLVAEGDHHGLGLGHVEGLEHLRPGHVPEEHGQAPVARLDRLLGVVVEAHVPDELLVQQVAHHLADAPVAADDDEVLARRVGRLGLDLRGLFVLAQVVAEALLVLHGRGHVGRDLAERGRGRHGQGHGGHEQLGLRPGEDAQPFGQGEGHKGELPALGEQQARLQRVGQAEAQGEAEPRGDGRLDGERATHGRGHQRGPLCQQGQVDLEAHRHEEQAQQDAAEGRHVGLHLVAVVGLPEQHAGQEGAQRVAEAQALAERAHAQHRGEDDGEEGLLAARLGHRVEQRVHGEPAEQGDGPEAERGLGPGHAHGRHHGAAAGRQQRDGHQQRHDGQVLEEQDPEGGAPVARAHVLAVLQQLEHEGRAAEREAAAHGGGRVGGHAAAQRKGQRQRPARQRGHAGRRQPELQRAQPEDVAPHAHQPLHAELQAHLEEEEHDAELGQLGGGLDVGQQLQPRGPHEAADAQEAQDGRHAQLLAEGRDHGRGEQQQQRVPLLGGEVQAVEEGPRLPGRAQPHARAPLARRVEQVRLPALPARHAGRPRLGQRRVFLAQAGG
mmetsp:Transcript_29659/g.46759  ORF Transcript_29659/g.46759 Transcript_29659/m.46759 type:complete len:689 (-) Transcript_29659:598-2664(-)